MSRWRARPPKDRPSLQPRSGVLPISRLLLVTTPFTLAVGLLGAAAFQFLDAPLPWLLGSAAAVAAASLVTPVHVTASLRDAGLAALGLQVGASFTPEAAARLGGAPLAAVGLAVATAAAMVLAYVVLRRFARWDPMTAFLAAAPGAFSTTLALVAMSTVDARRVVAAQTLRLAVLVAVFPLVLPSGPVRAPDLVWGMAEASLVVPAALLAGGVLHWRRMPAAWILGPSIASAGLAVSGVTAGQPPLWVFHAGLVIIGAASGARISGGRGGFGGPDGARETGSGGDGARLNRRDIAAMAASFLAMMAVTAAIAAAVAATTPLSFPALLLAFTPGGFEAMVALAAALDLEPAFVSASHVARVLVLTLLMPVAFRRLAARAPSTEQAPDASRAPVRDDPSP